MFLLCLPANVAYAWNSYKKKGMFVNVNVRQTGIRCSCDVAPYCFLSSFVSRLFPSIVLDLLFFINEQPENGGWVRARSEKW